MKIVAISDTHCQLEKISVPDGDLLIHSGDLTFHGTVKEMSRELYLLQEMGKKFKHGVVLCLGNHDWLGQKEPGMFSALVENTNITYLEDSSTEIDGLKIYGSPYSPEFCGWAYGYSRYENVEHNRWENIPDDTNILITHGPPKGILDLTAGYESIEPSKLLIQEPEHVGCWDLRERIRNLKSLRAHIFGHIHHSYGREIVDGITFLNSSICDESYSPSNAPHVIDL